MVVSYKELADMVGVEYHSIKQKAYRGGFVTCSPGKIDTDNETNKKQIEQYQKKVFKRAIDIPLNKNNILKKLREHLSDDEIKSFFMGDATLVCIPAKDIERGESMSKIEESPTVKNEVRVDIF